MKKRLKKTVRQATARKGARASSQAAKLMTVAMDLFSQRDFASITIKDIAKAARVNSALIYYYFKNKEDLFRAMIENAILQALENYARLKGRHSNATDLINDWFENNVEMSDLMRQLVKIMIDYSHGSVRMTSVETLIRRFYREETSILSNGIRQGISEGIFRDVDPDRTALFISVQLDGIMVASMVRPSFNIAAAMNELREVFWQRVGRAVERAA
ncbi:MAG TPA: TetR/AcrR family transcriptional regulator [Stellaceae bacterium]|nr:TetR/AcrR family transcriptional regulator [Stellaceae bacterium]